MEANIREEEGRVYTGGIGGVVVWAGSLMVPSILRKGKTMVETRGVTSGGVKS